MWSPGARKPKPKPTKKWQRNKKTFDPAKHNSAFNTCYKGAVVPEEEWEPFLAALRAPLPTTFSFVSTGCQEVKPHLVQAQLGHLVERLGEQQLAAAGDDADAGIPVVSGTRILLRFVPRRDGRVRMITRVESVPAPRRAKPLSWFPGGLGWQLDTPRQELIALRAMCRELRQFLEAQCSVGRVNRQEAVSMLPPLLLDVRPGQAVLDMCASPGSKTVLLLSQLSRGGAGGAAPGTGCVVANDVNSLRIGKMRTRCAKLRCPGAVFTCHPAQSFPGAAASFDRVLCDVPCSGDGTLRKNPDIWASWQPRFSASLHPLQLAIVSRGLELLRPGGLLLYSTCSFAPVENEAVIAAALRGPSGRGVELVNLHGALPGLRTSPGLHSWRVTASADGSGVASLEEAGAEAVEAWRLAPSLFPPGRDEADRLALHRCMRLLPHANDTGGFFVAALRKPGPAGEQEAAAESAVAAAATAASEAAAAMARVEAAMAAARKAASEGDAGEAAKAAQVAKEAAEAAAVAVAAAEAASSASAARAERVAAAAVEGAAAGQEPSAAAIELSDRQPELEPELRALIDIVDGEASEAGEAGEGGEGGEGTGAAAGAEGGEGGRGRARAGHASDRDRFLSFAALDGRSELASQLSRFYGLPLSFPFARLFSAYAHTTSRRLYFTSAAAAEAMGTPGLRAMGGGVKVLERDDSAGVGCPYRIVQEGALLLLPYLGKRLLHVSPSALSALLACGEALPLLRPAGEASAPASAPPVAPQLTTLQAQLSAIRSNGSVLLAVGNGCGTARTAVVLMKCAARDPQRPPLPPPASAPLLLRRHTDKAVVFPEPSLNLP